MDIWGRQRKHMRPKGNKKNSSSHSSAQSTTSLSTSSISSTTPDGSTTINTRGMTLTVHVSSCSFPISCGDGKQTVKWLAIAAARRYGAEAPSGRVRHRESYHSGRRPRPDGIGRPNSPEFSSSENEAARNLPRYPQFGVTNHDNGRILRRVDGIGGIYRRGMLAPIRVSSPKRRHRNEGGFGSNEGNSDNKGTNGNAIHGFDPDDDGEDEEEEFWDAIQVTYDYARMEHPPDQLARIERERNMTRQKEDDLRRQQILGNFDISADAPSWRNRAAAMAATAPRPSTVYKLRELDRSNGRRRGNLVAQRLSQRGQPRRSMFATVSNAREEEQLRPTTTIAVTRPHYGGQSPATHIKNWQGPRLSVPSGFNTPADLICGLEEKPRISPNDLLCDVFVNGDHVWIDLDLDGKYTDLKTPFAEMAFHKKRYVTRKIKDDSINESVKTEEDTVVVAKKRRLLVTKRNLRDDQENQANRKILNKLLMENISKSKIHRVVKDEVEMIQCQKFVLEHYLILENTFRHFSFLAPGDNFSLSSNEWSAMCHATKILTVGPKIDAATCSRVFIASNVNLSARSGKKDTKPEPFDEDNPKNALIMYEFIEGIVRLALEKYSSLPNLRASQKLMRLLTEHIVPIGQEITDEWEKTLQKVEDDDVQDALERDLEGYVFVFFAVFLCLIICFKTFWSTKLTLTFLTSHFFIILFFPQPLGQQIPTWYTD